MMHKKRRQTVCEDRQTEDMDYWNHVPWSDETKVHLCASDGVSKRATRTKKSAELHSASQARFKRTPVFFKVALFLHLKAS